MTTKNVTFNDIAKYTNFSKTTISRFFNNPDSLTLENQEVIKKALVDLNYKENKLAKALAKGKSEFIGIILPNVFLHYYTEVLNKILLSYNKYGYKFLVFLGDDNKETEKAYIDELLAFQIEGLIVLSGTTPSKELSEYDIPIVTIEREDQYVNSINTDNYDGAVKATQALIDSGCELLIHINSIVEESSPAINRIKGFKDTCKNNNVDYLTYFKEFGDSFEEASKVISAIFEELEENYSDQIKGIFLSNDSYANIFLNKIFRHFGKLPETYKIIGFDDSPIAREGIIPMSTIGQEISEMADAAISVLDELIRERKKRKPKPQTELIHKQIKPKLILRETT